MDELLRILEDQATLSHWEFLVRHEGINYANVWLIAYDPRVAQGNTLDLLQQWYAGSQVIGGVIQGDPGLIPPEGQIPIDPRLRSGYLYEATVTLRPDRGGRDEFRTVFISSDLLLSGSELSQDAQQLLQAQFAPIGDATIGVNLNDYTVAGVEVEALWRAP